MIKDVNVMLNVALNLGVVALLHTHFMLVLQHVSGEICVVFVLDKLCGVSITAMNMNMEFILKQSAAAFSLLHPQVCTSVRAAESHKLLHTY